ncbi:23S rRNA (pseudouridine1915-N3)-methyltransferase [Fervidobacterium changbaicum]|uniref:Ribosomal RNA large subunit methyltransferase H n=2 Tax=Fervidobacterium TaxID=2422 RepID=A0AAI8CM74_FERIS|nr:MULTISPECIES: 23S rRNA (pseudouridine(1915)-N(3))-methyltransferase RlmH [Fervidobacterium]AMW33512.1 23S rRNA (pseudouridine(1915)-N(3))-methyltransferase RlmH [Fervidobacterium islandicum]QAV33575.1 23S rRNA (pseudouridine(1915)-N(3))-methyltransferase RlmH [Fervidobacterium changbaicum]SDH68930.1 23S rRNA (pseudouridine1915-N3)-methyltransferase [Fervidobacterium changbaicum]
MKIEIIIPGKISKHLLPAQEFYEEKISRFTKLDISFVPLGGDINTTDPKVILSKEAEYISRKLRERKYTLIDLWGKQMSSEEFAQYLDKSFLKDSELVFVIGGPLGIDESLRKKANEKISFSKMTFTHEMCLILLLEQIFRGFKILRNEKYHY